MGRPVPHDLFEAIEWVGLLKAVASACEGRFAMMELGAGWGPWLAAGAVAARLRGLHDLRLLGVEADPGRFALMRQHFLDNDLDPDAHRLVCAAVGVEAGHARWPRIADPPNAAGARPVQESGGKLDADDVAYMQGGLEDFIDVEIVPLGDLLAEQEVWDLVHIDVQGWEAKLCAGCVEPLNRRVRWLIIGTHSRPIDGEVIAILHAAGWVLENEKPTRFRFDPAKAVGGTDDRSRRRAGLAQRPPRRRLATRLAEIGDWFSRSNSTTSTRSSIVLMRWCIRTMRRRHGC